LHNLDGFQTKFSCWRHNSIPRRIVFQIGNFRMRNGRLTTGANHQPPVSIGRYAPSNSILIPPRDPPIERGIIAQALIDIAFVLVVSVSSLAIAGALFILLFVKT